MLDRMFERVGGAVDRALQAGPPPLALRQRGTVVHVGGAIARVRGLPAVGSEELVEFRDGLLGIAFGLDEDEVGVVLLGHGGALAAGDEVRATGRVTDTPVGESLLGRVVDAAGRPLDGGPPVHGVARRPVERDAPAIMDRAPVVEPLQTGIKAIDAMIPIGRGQRELIVGDRQTGKTAIAVGAIINQKETGVICIYCAIGQRGTAVARVVDALARHDVLKQTIVVAASANDAAGLQYVTPYAATAMGEYFMEQGRDVLIVYDDLVRHARAYRELSLLLRRPPGREAFPGDIFYIHSRMLERATRLRDERGGGSLTALPIVETEGQDISAYIPTNLISITDGQIYVSPRLFRAGLLPAIDVGRSVSRVGGKTQLAAYRAVVGDLKLSYAQFEELETFARFGTRLDEDTRAAIERGRRVREILKQDEYAALGVAEQLASLEAVHSGLLDAVDPDEIGAVEADLHRRLAQRLPTLSQRIESGARLEDADRAALREVVGEAVAAAKAGRPNGAAEETRA